MKIFEAFEGSFRRFGQLLGLEQSLLPLVAINRAKFCLDREVKFRLKGRQPRRKV